MKHFLPKDIRTCARILKKLQESGHSLEDLPSVAEALGKVGMGGYGLRFPVQVPISQESKISGPTLMESAGWPVIRSWLRFDRLVKKTGLGLEQMRAFVQAERHKWLEAMPSGRVASRVGT